MKLPIGKADTTAYRPQITTDFIWPFLSQLKHLSGAIAQFGQMRSTFFDPTIKLR
jgi:hypothetical protein